MAYLPLANILHHKLRSALSALGIGIGVCMLITLGGLSRGSLYEVADRWEAVQADLILTPRHMGDAAVTSSGAMLSDRYAEKITADHREIVRRVVPVFLYPMHLGGQDQHAVGVDPEHFELLVGGRELTEGRVFDPGRTFSAWLEKQLLTGGDDVDESEPFDPSEAELSAEGRNGLEIVIDTRLAGAGGYRVGQKVFTANHHWTIVGIVEAGGMGRVFLPRRTAQFLFADADLSRSTLMFVQLRAGVDQPRAARTLRDAYRINAVPLSSYRGMLTKKFSILFLYVDAVNAVALVIAFLFILVTLYTMVLQRTREIAILKSCGASAAYLLRMVLAESLLLTAAGTAAGIAMSFLAAWLIEAFRPLLTVTITWEWIALAAAAAAIGGTLSSLYPAWRATRVDMVEALTFE